MKTLLTKLTKKNIFLIALVGTILVCSQFIFDSKTCGSNQLCNRLGDIFNQDNATIILNMPIVLLFSLTTYRMRDEIFHTWISFVKWWVPFSCIIILIAPKKIEGSISVPVKEPLAFLCAALLLLISLGIICWKHFSLKKTA